MHSNIHTHGIIYIVFFFFLILKNEKFSIHISLNSLIFAKSSVILFVLKKTINKDGCMQNITVSDMYWWKLLNKCKMGFLFTFSNHGTGLFRRLLTFSFSFILIFLINYESLCIELNKFFFNWHFFISSATGFLNRFTFQFQNFFQFFIFFLFQNTEKWIKIDSR